MKVLGTDIRVDGRLVRIAAPELDSYEALRDPEALIEALRSSDVRADLFTFIQAVTDTTPRYSYSMEWDNLAVLPVSTFDHWWTRQIRSFPRNRARQAEKKGVVLRELPFDDFLVSGIWEIYNESKVRQGKRNVHYGKDIETVRREEATFLDRSTFIGALFEGRLIGFVKLVTDREGKQANLMNIVAMIGHRDKAPTNALIAESVRVCARRGIDNLLYQNFAYHNKPNSLTAFKEVNGFQRVDLPRYYVPLTRFGRIAYRLGLHHSPIEYLPDPLVDRLRALRSAYYDRGAKVGSDVS